MDSHLLLDNPKHWLDQLLSLLVRLFGLVGGHPGPVAAQRLIVGRMAMVRPTRASVVHTPKAGHCRQVASDVRYTGFQTWLTNCIQKKWGVCLWGQV